MKGQSNSTNRIFKIERIFYKTTKELGRSNKVNGISTRYYEEIIQQEKIKFTEIKGRRQCVVRS